MDMRWKFIPGWVTFIILETSKKASGEEKNRQCNFPFDYFVFKDGNVEGKMHSTTVIVA